MSVHLSSIIGLNNNEHQVRNARKYTKKAELGDKISYVTGDFTKMDFPDNYFDAVCESSISFRARASIADACCRLYRIYMSRTDIRGGKNGNLCV